MDVGFSQLKRMKNMVQNMRALCVGTGPFVIDKIMEGTQVRLVKNEKYWEKDDNDNKLPYIRCS